MAEKGKYVYEWPRPMVSTDAVVFTVESGRLKFLLIKRGQEPYKGKWAFPGGFLEMEEELEVSAARELYEETGLEGIDLWQMRTFGKVGRDPRGRQITVAFIGRANPEYMNMVRAGDDAAEAGWFSPDELPELAFDHDRVAEIAVKKAKEMMERSG